MYFSVFLKPQWSGDSWSRSRASLRVYNHQGRGENNTGVGSSRRKEAPGQKVGRALVLP